MTQDRQGTGTKKAASVAMATIAAVLGAPFIFAGMIIIQMGIQQTSPDLFEVLIQYLAPLMAAALVIGWTVSLIRAPERLTIAAKVGWTIIIVAAAAGILLGWFVAGGIHGGGFAA